MFVSAALQIAPRRPRSILPKRRELWAVWTAQPRTGFGEPRYRALFAVAVASDEVARPITRCELGRTPLAAKRPIDRATAAALHPAVGDELDRHDPALDIAEVDALLSAEGGQP